MIRKYKYLIICLCLFIVGIHFQQTKAEEIDYEIIDGTYYYMGDPNVSIIQVPKGAEEISAYAFSGLTNLKKVVISSSVKTIGASAFYGCTSLKEVIIPNSVTQILESAFEDCTSLTKIVLPNKIQHISYGLFSGCQSLVSVILPENLKTIDKHVFYYCDNLKELKIPATVKTVGESTFGDVDKSMIVICSTFTKFEAFDYYENIRMLYYETIITQLNLGAKSKTLYIGQTYTILPSVMPSNAYYGNISYKSSNKSIATVASDGKIKPIKPGTVKIIVAAKNNIDVSRVFTVTVKDNIKNVKITSSSKTVKKRSILKLKATVTPINSKVIYNKNVTWTTSNSKIATINTKGEVKGVKAGTVTITAKSQDNPAKKITIKITVK